jgi:hypothetical protein
MARLRYFLLSPKVRRLLDRWRGSWRLLTAHGRVEIVLATVHWLIVGGPFDVDALARLLSALA